MHERIHTGVKHHSCNVCMKKSHTYKGQNVNCINACFFLENI